MSALSRQCPNFQLETEQCKAGHVYSWSVHPQLPWGDLEWLREEEVLLTPCYNHVHFLSILFKHPLCISINLKEKGKAKLTASVALQKAESKQFWDGGWEQELCACSHFPPTGWLCLVLLRSCAGKAHLNWLIFGGLFLPELWDNGRVRGSWVQIPKKKQGLWCSQNVSVSRTEAGKEQAFHVIESSYRIT